MSHLPTFRWPKQATWLSRTSPGQACLLLFSWGQTAKSHGDFGYSRGRGWRTVCSVPERASQPVGPGLEPRSRPCLTQHVREQRKQNASNSSNGDNAERRGPRACMVNVYVVYSPLWVAGGRVPLEDTSAVLSLGPTSVKWGERLQSHSLRGGCED